eukprot:COSAG01_NODE_5932_length_3946_cov_1.712763_2_plen_84_part_00
MDGEGPTGVGETFTASGKRVLEPGFTAVMPHLAVEESALPPLRCTDLPCRRAATAATATTATTATIATTRLVRTAHSARMSGT